MGAPRTTGERSGDALEGLQSRGSRSRSFAEFVAALNELNRLESSLATVIARARVPVQEVRTLLRAQTPDQAENAPAFQFMREVFAQVGIPLTVEGLGRFSLRFGVEASPYARLFAGQGSRKTCEFVSQALTRFLTSDLGLPSQVEEVSCRNEGADRCAFAASLDPLPVAARALDDTDWRLFEALANAMPPAEASRSIGLSHEERDYRMETLIGYGLVGKDGDLRANGEALARAGRIREDAFEAPWREVSRLSAAIANAASAAEALVEVAPNPPGQETAPDAETASLAEECHSFAELLARASKGRAWE